MTGLFPKGRHSGPSYAIPLSAAVFLVSVAATFLAWNFAAADRPRGSLVLVGSGLFVGLLLSALAWFSTKARARGLLLAKAMTEELRESREQFRAVTATANDAIISADSGGRIIHFNLAAERMLGYAAEEALGRPLTLIMPERFRSAHLQGVQHFLETAQPRIIGKTLELAARHRDGKEIPIEISVANWATTKGTYFTGILRDITERKHILEELRRGEARFRLLIESVVDYAIVMLDPEGRIASWNAGAERIEGYRAEEILGRHFSCFYTAEDIERRKPWHEIEAASAAGRCADEGRRIRKDGSTFWASAVIAAIRDEGGELRGFSMVTRDLTERKRAEEALTSLNASLEERTRTLEALNRELEAFAYSVSHDLRAPLRTMDGFSQVLIEDYGDRLDDRARDYIQRIRGGSIRMGHLIDGLLKLSRTTRAGLAPSTVDLSALARLAIAAQRERDPARNVSVEIEPGMTAVADPRLIEVALENLLGNAWKFTSRNPEARIAFGRTQQNGRAVYYIRDDGAGFDMAYAHKLFAPFQRLHRTSEFDGTGIGLATVWRILHRHGGTIWLESETGKGTTVYFTL